MTPSMNSGIGEGTNLAEEVHTRAKTATPLQTCPHPVDRRDRCTAGRVDTELPWVSSSRRCSRHAATLLGNHSMRPVRHDRRVVSSRPRSVLRAHPKASCEIQRMCAACGWMSRTRPSGCRVRREAQGLSNRNRNGQSISDADTPTEPLSEIPRYLVV